MNAHEPDPTAPVLDEGDENADELVGEEIPDPYGIDPHQWPESPFPDLPFGDDDEEGED